MPKSNRNCCVVNCRNTPVKTEGSKVRYHAFPNRSWEAERRKKWILAVKRINADGAPWQPTKNSFVCSEHFVGGKMSNIEHHPAYVPSVFHEIYKRKGKTEADVSRFVRIYRRNKRSNMEVGSNQSANYSVSKNGNTNRTVQASIEGCEMDSNANIKEEVDVLEGGISIENDFSSSNRERTLKNDATKNQYDFEMDSKIRIRDVDNINTGLPHGKELSSMDHEKKSGNDFEMDIKTNIKEEVGNLDLGLSFESVWFSTDFGNEIKKETVICGNDFEFDKSKVSKDFTFVSDIGFQKEQKCVSSDCVKKIGKEFIPYNKKHEVSTETQCQSEAPVSNILLHIKNRDMKVEDTKLPETSSLYEEGDSSHKAALFSSKDLGKDVSLNTIIDSHECERPRNFQNQESDVTDKHVSKQKCVPDLDKDIKIRKVYTCVTCEKGFTRKMDLKNHKLIHKNKCNICNKSFTRLSSLKAHTLIHEGKKPHKCNICDKAFTVLSDLKRHTLIHEGRKPHKCTICDKAFTVSSSLKKHILVHEGKKPYKCNICGKYFTTLSNLKTHTLIHEGKKPYKCDICEKRFSQFSYLNLHTLIHEGRKPYKCDICDKSFALSSYLSTHTLIHEGKRPYECKICDKAFTQLTNLKTHSLIHKGQKPHKCSICDKAFTQLSGLKRHILLHEGKRPFKCSICNKTFTLLSNLKTHTLVHEGKMPHKCNLCDRAFTHLSYLKRHILTHEVKEPHK